MTFVNYKNSNNASSLLIADISATATTILITDGDQGLFPSEFPFLLTIEHLDSESNVVLREIVKATASNQNSFTVVRGAGTCVQDDTASNRSQDNTKHAFYSGDKISLYRTAEQSNEIGSRLETSASDTAIANEYSTTTSYSAGDVVMYLGDRYEATASTSGTFDSTKRTKVSVQYEIADYGCRIDTIETTIETLGGIYLNYALAGGGGGGASCTASRGGAGGGGGGTAMGTINLQPGTYSVCIGLGGAACTSSFGSGGTGGDTYFYNTTTGCKYAIALGGKGGQGLVGGESGNGYKGNTCGTTNNYGCAGGGGGAGGNAAGRAGVCVATRAGQGIGIVPPNYGGNYIEFVGCGGGGANGYSYSGSCVFRGEQYSCCGSGGAGGGCASCTTSARPYAGCPGVALFYVVPGQGTITGGTTCCGLQRFTSDSTFTLSI